MEYKMSKIHEVEGIKTTDMHLYLTVDGQPYRIKWTDCSTKLSNTTTDRRTYLDVSPSGYGLHWPLLDEDLAITPLLRHAEALSFG